MEFVYDPAKFYPSLSSIFVDDEFFDCKWSPSSRRCDRGTGNETACSIGYREAPYGVSMSSGSRPRRTGIDELFLYCTEELGSESTSGAGHVFPATTTNSNYRYDANIATDSNDICLNSTTTSSNVTEAISPLSFSEDHVPLRRCSSHVHAAALEHHVRSNIHHHHRSSVQCTAAVNAQTFPPPLSSLLCDRPVMRSFKANGRFILKKIANASQSLFQSTRKDGRLRLNLLLSPFDDELDGQCFPNSANSPSQCFLGAPVPSLRWSIPVLSHKPKVSYENLRPKTLAMLMQSNSMCMEKPRKPLSASTLITKCQTTTAMTLSPLSMPRVFALLSLFPAGLGLLIFEFGQSQFGDYVTLHGVYIMKSQRFECSDICRNFVLPSLCER